jgi:hypothetical protein
MAHPAWVFDPSAPLRGWDKDPGKSSFDNLFRLNECYSIAYRRCVDEIRRLKEENFALKQALTQAQAFIDHSISDLDFGT